jgi:hypothetical protein
VAYFSNSTEGDVLLIQCSRCKYGKRDCPIFFVQFNWNYEACNNKTARLILDYLINNDGECKMFKEFKKDFEIDPNQLEIDF